MSSDWTVVGNIANVQTLAAAALTGAAARYLQTLPENIRAQLTQCRLELDELERNINKLSGHQLQCLEDASQEGRCSSLAQLKNELNR